jgi:hypothetical protein
MDLENLITESAPIKLSDMFSLFKEMEGEVPEEERVWVTVRQVTQEDQMKRSALLSKRETKYARDSFDDGALSSVSDVVDDNIPRRHMLEAYYTLTGVGNLNNAGKPVFSMTAKKRMPQGEFEKAWGSLRPEIAIAIHEAVLSVNPMWGERSGEL